MSLQEKALLVNLSCTKPAFSKQDTQLILDAENKYNVERGQVTSYRRLFRKSDTEALVKSYGKVWTFLYSQTLPWGGRGERLIASENFDNFVSEMKKLSDVYLSEVEAFKSNIHTIINRAITANSSLAKSEDYSKLGRMLDQFGYSLTISGIPDSDIRANISEIEKQKLEAQLKLREQLAVESAKNDIYEKIKLHLSELLERIISKDAKGMHESALEKISEFKDLISSYNFLDEKAFADISKALETIPECSSDLLKDSQTKRAEFANKAKDVLSTIDSYL
jgi:hypothetical protein